MLETLAEIGMKVARKIGEEADLPRPEHSHNMRDESALSFSRVSRAIRLTLVLHEKFEAQAKAPAEPDEARPWLEHGMTEEEWAEYRRVWSRTFNTQMLVTSAIDKEQRSEGEKGRLVEELHERLNEASEQELFDTDAPLSGLIEGICADIGIAVDWSQWPHDDFGPIDDRTILELRDISLEDAEPDTADAPTPREQSREWREHPFMMDTS